MPPPCFSLRPGFFAHGHQLQTVRHNQQPVGFGANRRGKTRFAHRQCNIFFSLSPALTYALIYAAYALLYKKGCGFREEGEKGHALNSIMEWMKKVPGLFRTDQHMVPPHSRFRFVSGFSHRRMERKFMLIVMGKNLNLTQHSVRICWCLCLTEDLNSKWNWGEVFFSYSGFLETTACGCWAVRHLCRESDCVVSTILRLCAHLEATSEGRCNLGPRVSPDLPSFAGCIWMQEVIPRSFLRRLVSALRLMTWVIIPSGFSYFFLISRAVSPVTVFICFWVTSQT